MKQILVQLFISLKQAIVSLFRRRRTINVSIDTNHDGEDDITINVIDNDDKKGV